MSQKLLKNVPIEIQKLFENSSKKDEELKRYILQQERVIRKQSGRIVRLEERLRLLETAFSRISSKKN